MESRAKVLGHPVHPMLITFPLGLFATAVVFDLIDVFGGPEGLGQAAYWNILVGLIVGVAAGVAGLVDYTAIPSGTRAKRVGLLHGAVNLLVLVLFAAAWALRAAADGYGATTPALALQLIAAVAAGGSAWLGGELVDRLGVGVDPDAGLDASSSLRRPARERQVGRPVAR
ncbi:MAG TPA: DUF2231 domain-containing protein [Pilimelia sp.]|nr:DUF2231 domain-containing protein [Pilimelia sp.]